MADLIAILIVGPALQRRDVFSLNRRHPLKLSPYLNEENL
jgi:hypothetical protein